MPRLRQLLIQMVTQDLPDYLVARRPDGMEQQKETGSFCTDRVKPGT
ncbi:hypothetical protein KDX31_14125 [Amphritea atlantica]|uniref:Uncharacterized protein n=1 Tax=Amphritea atlantica TaxID=355243 RepID=A0ABY5GRV5_9GAMM|nr:hypothetical protein KDX31_14125 [Amphritea atlantica]